MFTGIVEEQGRLRQCTPNEGGAHLEFEAERVLEDARIGDSIAVDGCCLTIVERGADWWACDAVQETLGRTSLGGLQVGDAVNLERSVRLNDRLGGHLVQGHVDGRGQIADWRDLSDDSTLVAIEVEPALLRYVVEKGSIAVDGVSLTVVRAGDTRFEVALIPHTKQVTTLGSKRPGDHVNIEVDLFAKYVERLLGRQ
jgi:riboflavin synthase